MYSKCNNVASTERASGGLLIIVIASLLHLYYSVDMIKQNEESEYADLLRQAGLRATPGRILLLKLLEQEPKPLTVYQIEKKLHGKVNQVTIYRSLDALYKVQIVKRVNLEHDHAHFELAAGREHHHHAVCRNCGHVENIEVPHAPKPEEEALKRSKSFSILDSYSLEFFGVCIRCSK
ncbi:MAG: Transcriptional regulator, Fur family [Parcubacteria group bacterium]|nr:Transcriptional regulator, Fur family [Parcubacteria group bacterium]